MYRRGGAYYTDGGVCDPAVAQKVLPCGPSLMGKAWHPGTPLRMGSEEESHDWPEKAQWFWAFHSYTTSPSQSDMGEVTP